jgi:hypothetical protein
MSLSRTDARQLLERLIFEDMVPDDWVQDVWSLSPIHGETAAKLLEVFKGLIDTCPEGTLEMLVEGLYQDHLEG